MLCLTTAFMNVGLFGLCCHSHLPCIITYFVSSVSGYQGKRKQGWRRMKTKLQATRVTQPRQTKCGTKHMFVWENGEHFGGNADLDLKLDLGICSQPPATRFRLEWWDLITVLRLHALKAKRSAESFREPREMTEWLFDCGLSLFETSLTFESDFMNIKQWLEQHQFKYLCISQIRFTNLRPASGLGQSWNCIGLLVLNNQPKKVRL